MALAKTVLDIKHLEYRDRQFTWDSEFKEFLFIVKHNSLSTKNLNVNPAIYAYKTNLRKTLVKVKQIFQDINVQLFLDNAMKLDLEDGKEIISYEWFENNFLKDIERIFKINNELFQKLKKFTPNTKMVEVNPYGKTLEEVQIEKLLNKCDKITKIVFNKLEQEYLMRKHADELIEILSGLYLEFTR
jgi:hypothetical protein